MEKTHAHHHHTSTNTSSQGLSHVGMRSVYEDGNQRAHSQAEVEKLSRETGTNIKGFLPSASSCVSAFSLSCSLLSWSLGLLMSLLTAVCRGSIEEVGQAVPGAGLSFSSMFTPLLELELGDLCPIAEYSRADMTLVLSRLSAIGRNMRNVIRHIWFVNPCFLPPGNPFHPLSPLRRTSPCLRE
jgi:hypothetical protein